MKKIALMGLAAFIAGSSPASAAKVKVRFFEVNEAYVYQLTDGVPGSEFALYSRRDGGKEIYTGLFSADGRQSFTAAKNFHPGFVLNKKRSTQTRVEGNSKVAQVGESLFSLNRIRLAYEEGGAVLHWEAGFKVPAGYTLEVLRSTDNETYVPVYAAAGLYQTVTPYSFRDDAGSGEAARYYKIRVTGKADDVAYTTDAYSSNDVSRLDVFPTLAQDALYVRLLSTAGETVTDYTVVDMLGRVVARDVVPGSSSFSIRIADLPPGNYVLHAGTSGHVTKTGRFVRQAVGVGTP